MAVKEKWVAGDGYGFTWTSMFGTELNSLVAGKTVLSSVDVVNQSNLDMFMDVCHILGAVSPTGSPFLSLFLLPLLSDGSTYGDGQWASATTGVPGANYYVGLSGLVTGTTIAIVGDFQMPGRRTPIVIPPGTFRFAVYNGLNVNFASSGNTIKGRTYNRSVG